MITRRDVQLFFISIAFGPLLGVLYLYIHEFRSNIPMPYGFEFKVVLSYVLGAVPAALGAIITSIVSRWLPRQAWRILAAPFIGMLAVGIPLLLIGLESSFGHHPPKWSAWLKTCGELSLFVGLPAGLICTLLVEIFAAPFRQARLKGSRHDYSV